MESERDAASMQGMHINDSYNKMHLCKVCVSMIQQNASMQGMRINDTSILLMHA